MKTGPIKPEPFEFLAKAAATRRAELARMYMTESSTQALLGIDAATLGTLREGKRLLGVWHEPVNAWLYPDFQFDKSGLIKTDAQTSIGL